MMKRTAALLLLGTQLIWAQGHFESGELKGFTKSPTEGVVTHLENSFVVQRVSGTISRSVGDKSPLDGVLFELRGPGGTVAIRSVKTAPDGRFQITNLPPGKYMFKATVLGFQSLVGVVIVSPKAASDRNIKLHMRPGV